VLYYFASSYKEISERRISKKEPPPEPPVVDITAEEAEQVKKAKIKELFPPEEQSPTEVEGSI